MQKMSKFISIVAILFIFSGCSRFVEIIQPVNEYDFPIGFVRQSDGAVITIGMTRDEAETAMGGVFLSDFINEPPPTFRGKMIGTAWGNGSVAYIERVMRPSRDFGFIGSIGIVYDNVNQISGIQVVDPGWIINGMYIGMNLQDALYVGGFMENHHAPDFNAFVRFDDLDNSNYMFLFVYEDERVINIELSCLSDTE